MDDYKEDVRDERNIQPLSDDYIKFIRFAHWKIAQAGKGILGFITNNSYLSGVIHRGMRKKLLETFDEIYILNLHGSSRIGEKTPDGGKDENVFDIQQGVAIALYVKSEKPFKEKAVHYADLWGLREEKYKYLFENDFQTTKWQKLEPFAPYYFFVPKDFALQAEYERFWKVTEIFKEWASGVKTHRDHFIVGFSKEEIAQRLRVFTGSLTDELVKESLNLKDTRDWNLREARGKAKQEKLEGKIYPYVYRAFDNRRICYSLALIEQGCDRWNLMRHFILATEGNIALTTTRQLSSPKFNHSFVAANIADMCSLSTKTKETTYFFPLYLYPEESVGAIHELPLRNKSQSHRFPNFTPAFLRALREPLNSKPSPEEIFHYIYAVLYSPTYRKRYEEFLKIDFPRVPMPSSYDVFKELSNLGKDLVDLHLLKHPELEKTDVGFPNSDSNKVEKIAYAVEDQKVFINKEQYFEGIPKEVWEYRIGSYQVTEKYLKDRKGRKLSLDEINHYMKVAKAIQLTIELQEKIDDIYRKTEN